MQVAPRTLVAGVPARLLRTLRDEEVAWKLAGTQTYQDLTLRCLASLKEVQPLPAAEPDRPRVRAPEVKSLIASKRGETAK